MAKLNTAETNSLMQFPVLPVGKTNRLFTKHYTNMAMVLNKDEFSLLSWLCYRCRADNVFSYDTNLLEMYSGTLKHVSETYKAEVPNRSLIYIRVGLRNLIDKGIILKTGNRKYYMVNPMLTYCPDVVSKVKYNEFQEMYNQSNELNVGKFVTAYFRHVSAFLSAKKKGYEYGKNKK